MKGGKVFLFEFADEVEAFLDQNIDGIQKLNEAAGVIGLKPSAQIKLKNIGVDAYDSLPFFGRKGHENVLDASEKMVREIRKVINIFDKTGISENYSHFIVFYTRIFIHNLLFFLELLEQIQSVHNPSTLSVTATSQEPGQLELNSQFSYLGPVTNSFANARNIGYEHACTLKNKSGTVEIWGDGKEKRDLLHIDDLVSFVKKIAFKPKKILLFHPNIFSSDGIYKATNITIGAHKKETLICHLQPIF